MHNRTLMRGVVVAVLLAVPILIYLAPAFSAGVLAFFAFFAPLWLPALLVWIAWPLWLTFVRSHFVMSIPYSTIELKPGAETPRSARPMELVFYALYHRTDLTLTETYLMGHVRMPWSFEVLGHANTVRFFVHLPTAHRQAVEARIRSEYRDIDIDQVRDYAREIPWNPYSMKLSMREHTLRKADPYPLKTYVAYEDDKKKRDAFTEVLEQMAAAGDNEYALLSIIIRPHQREREKMFGPLKDSLHEDAQKEIVKLLGKGGDINAVPEKTKKTIAAIEAALKKPSFDCGVRTLYIARHENYSAELEGRLENLLSAYNDPELNGFAPYDPNTKITWPLSDVFVAVPALMHEYFLQLFRRRAFFYPPYYGNAFVLNTEELATVFHLPHFARASALADIRGVRLEPPENLPV
ncbi:hypothetical protein K2X83_02650 [Patescibacteria group bacterium]|nr:hypothetical protein [Patescibacteria group bacterium]